MTPTRHLPSLAVLRSFEAAARHESFTHAAEELNLTQGAISRQVKELEETIGAPLFRREGRSVRLTQTGFDLARSLSSDLESLRNSISEAMAAGKGRSLLKLAVLPTFCDRWLVPRLSDFLSRHPEIQLSIATRDRPFNLSEERFDMAIHFGRDDWPGGHLTHLCSETLFAVASPAFRDRHEIEDPADLTRVPLLQLETRAGAWSDWFAFCGLAQRNEPPSIQFDQFSTIITAAKHALGAALLPSYLIEPELQSGSLVRLVEKELSTDNSYCVVAASKDPPVNVRKMTHWLLENLKSLP